VPPYLQFGWKEEGGDPPPSFPLTGKRAEEEMETSRSFYLRKECRAEKEEFPFPSPKPAGDDKRDFLFSPFSG